MINYTMDWTQHCLKMTMNDKKSVDKNYMRHECRICHSCEMYHYDNKYIDHKYTKGELRVHL